VVWLYWPARTYVVAKQQKVLLKFSDGHINTSQGKNVKTELNRIFYLISEGQLSVRETASSILQ